MITGFPTRYKGAEKATGDQWWLYYNKAMEKLQAGGIVVMYGEHGTGKTRMAYELALAGKFPRSTYKQAGIEKDLPRIYTTAVNLFMDLRETFRDKSETSEKSIIKSMSDAALLVIDEVQERGETAFEDRKLTQIIDLRYSHAKPTILISNYSKERFIESLSPAIVDRIRETGIGLHFNWNSYRKR